MIYICGELCAKDKHLQCSGFIRGLDHRVCECWCHGTRESWIEHANRLTMALRFANEGWQAAVKEIDRLKEAWRTSP